ncbi:helix-turn-helix transcriptional regulator [Actinoplanes sp. CA-252034]|uniref:helix-turn-helix transcriptional regulator n=1 Tax=Actinoplanes sp. CA-252034 TaxID=3239906 RepID=UPI003D9776D5
MDQDSEQRAPMGAFEVQQRLGLSKKRADILMSRPDFPTPLASLSRGRVWAAADIEEWIRVHRPHLATEAAITAERKEAPPLDHEGREAALAEAIQVRLAPAMQNGNLTVEEISQLAARVAVEVLVDEV